MTITRRTALKTLAAAGATTLFPEPVSARSAKRPSPDAVAILYDPTLCVGCRECINGCAEANGCAGPTETDGQPQLSTTALSVLHRFEVDGEDTFRKVQCMHCVDPACVSACMLGAMQKNDDGSVTWNGDLCVGCRYCQIACPFNIPRFEWDTPTPSLTKCELCPERRAEGLQPACVEKCRRGALLYGTREDMLQEARQRIANNPERYQRHIYGEHEGGGTSVLYLAPANVAFADMGLPRLGTESIPSLPETIQHTIYKGFIAPVALFGVFAGVVRRNTKKLHEEEAKHHHTERSEPVGGKLLTWPVLGLLALVVWGVASVLWRFAAGLGATTNLNDGYAMGLWIAFDVVTGTALACGGYAMALLVYVANRGKYHPLVRAAILTSALGYTLGGMSVLIDIGRAWNFYKIPLFFWEWNFNSILLEVALCIMAYTTVLWIEMSPVFLERWRESRVEGLKKFALIASPKIERAMPYLIAVGLVLPTMHQSSLGSLMLLAGPKLHPLWATPLLPALFLVSVVGMGYAAVVLEATISARVFDRPRETPMLRALAGPVAMVLLAYAALRMWDVVNRDQLGAIAAMDFYSALFLVEMTLFVGPALGLLLRRRSAGAGFLATMGVMVILGGALYRFSTYLIAFDPGAQWSYFPALPEFAVTIGLVAAEILGYVILVKKFPVLRGVPPEGTSHDTPAPRRVPRKAALSAGAADPLAVGAVVLLVALVLAGATAGMAQVSGSRYAATQAGDTSRLGDLRCLTARADQCLDEPVPRDEPHGAVCATCHDLWEQGTPAGAAGSCAASGCHDDPAALDPFHATLGDQVLEDCLGCHQAHDARIPGGAEDCTYCHAEAGRIPPIAAGAAGDHPALRVTASLTFAHDYHGDESCTSCHDTGIGHGLLRVSRLEDCRSCHHTEPVASDCGGCHYHSAVPAARPVTWTFDLERGSLDRPERSVPFDHELHGDVECRTCHTEGSGLAATTGACSSCHEEHHRPDADCTTCHKAPVAGAHTTRAHMGCGGSSCHTGVSAAIADAPRTRELCLSCHQDLKAHEPQESCAACHRLPAVRSRGDLER